MSIPRLAIQRPVTMFMLSAVIVLLGADLADAAAGRPDAGVQQPTHHGQHELPRRRSARDRGTDHAADRAGGQRGAPASPASTRSRREGGSNVRLNFAWGTNLDAAADEVRSRSTACAAACRRKPIRRRSSRPTRTRCRSCRSASKATTTRSRCASSRENEICAAPRTRRRRGGGHRQRRPPPADSRRPVEGKDHRAQSVGRSRRAGAAQSENQNTPLGEIDQGDSTYLVRSQGQFQSIDDIREPRRA